MAKRKRDVPVLFWMSQNEMEQLRAKLARSCCGNMSAYLRKMALDGYCVNLDLPELTEMSRLLRICSNNLNQYARQANTTGGIYQEDIRDIRVRLDEIWSQLRSLLTALSAVK